MFEKKVLQIYHLRTLSPSLVWCYDNVGGDEKSPVFSRWNHIIRLVPDLDENMLLKMCWRWGNIPVRTSCAWTVVHWPLLRMTVSILSPEAQGDEKIKNAVLKNFCRHQMLVSAQCFVKKIRYISFPKKGIYPFRKVQASLNFSWVQVLLGS